MNKENIGVEEGKFHVEFNIYIFMGIPNRKEWS